MHDRPEKDIAAITPLLGDLFEIAAVYRRNSHVVFSLNFRTDREQSLLLLKDRLKSAGYTFVTHVEGEILILSVDPRPRLKIPRTNIVLFVLTIFSVYFAAVFWRYSLVRPAGYADDLGSIFNETVQALLSGAGIEFTAALMSILLVHEMGHFVASRRRNIVTSWPYFIPAPNLIGSFGAVIKSKSPFWNRRDLIEVGAAGPIAGWIVAIAWLLYGLSQSQAIAPSSIVPGDIPFSLTGESILMRLGSLLFMGPLPDGFSYRLTEAAFAGWVGLLVTAINLLPIGQLDGGHIVYGLLRHRQQVLGRIAMVALFVLGFQSMMWWLFAAFGLLFGVTHPPTLDDSRPPGRPATVMGIAALVILFLSFTPAPF